MESGAQTTGRSARAIHGTRDVLGQTCHWHPTGPLAAQQDRLASRPELSKKQRHPAHTQLDPALREHVQDGGR